MNRLLEQVADLGRIGVAHGVGETYAIRARVEHRVDKAKHFRGLDAALQRAAEGSADSDLDQAIRLRGVTRRPYSRDFKHDIVRRLAQIRDAVRLAR